MESLSENHGLAALSPKDKKIYSVGISTGGQAEIRMALKNPECQITATTIDCEGAEFAKKHIEKAHLSHQIDVKIEDITKPLPYPDGYFHLIYARLVLHYLPLKHLTQSLHELHRILAKQGKIFIVVRSVDCLDAQSENALYDPETRMTSYSFQGALLSRYFHSEKSIQEHLTDSGFQIQKIQSYEEVLCSDFKRLQVLDFPDVLIEAIATK